MRHRVLLLLAFVAAVGAAPAQESPLLVSSDEANSKVEALASNVSVANNTLAANVVIDVSKQKGDARKIVAKLEALQKIDANRGRPPVVKFTWGHNSQFEGVLEHVNVKYTMFLEDGTPVRASGALRGRESVVCAANQPCPTGYACRAGRCILQPRE